MKMMSYDSLETLKVNDSREVVTISWREDVQIIDWTDGSQTESWPLTCRNCGKTTSDYWDKKEWFYLQQHAEDVFIRFCSGECVARFAAGVLDPEEDTGE